MSDRSGTAPTIFCVNVPIAQQLAEGRARAVFEPRDPRFAGQRRDTNGGRSAPPSRVLVFGRDHSRKFRGGRSTYLIKGWVDYAIDHLVCRHAIRQPK